MRINSINNNSFKGLVKFNNKTINPNQIVSIEQTDSKNYPNINKSFKIYYFTMSNGEKYTYSALTTPGKWSQKFEEVVNRTMGDSKEIIEIDEEISQLK